MCMLNFKDNFQMVFILLFKQPEQQQATHFFFYKNHFYKNVEADICLHI